MSEYHDPDDWGDILFEESDTNREKRGGPRAGLGRYFLLLGPVDFVIAIGMYFVLTTMFEPSEIPMWIVLLIVAIFLMSGICVVVLGLYFSSQEAKKLVILKNGILRGNDFTHYDNIRQVEVRGPDEKVLVLKKGETEAIKTDLETAKRQASYAFVLEASYEFDHGAFIENLKKVGFGSSTPVIKKDEEGPAPAKDDGGDTARSKE